MPDRAIIPFTVAAMGGFFCGLVGAVLELQNGPIATIAFCGALATALAAAASVLGVPGEDHLSVLVLRVFYGVLLFVAVDFGLVKFLRDGQFGMAMVLWIAGALAAGMLATPRVKDPPEERERQDASRTGAQHTA
jgi:hypothetical protein